MAIYEGRHSLQVLNGAEMNFILKETILRLFGRVCSLFRPPAHLDWLPPASYISYPNIQQPSNVLHWMRPFALIQQLKILTSNEYPLLNYFTCPYATLSQHAFQILPLVAGNAVDIFWMDPLVSE